MKHELLINGNWVKAVEYTELLSPYSGEMIAQVPVATEEQVDQAIQAADLARDKMAKMTAFERSTILENLVVKLKERREEAAQIIAKEAAKPIRTARQEVDRTIETYKFAAEEAKRIHGETIPLDAAASGGGRVAYTTYEPLGIIGAITPFNFPMNLVAHKLGPAIATGNTIVLKPASQTPLSSFFIGELLQEAGLPSGALNIVTGKGSVVGEKIVKNDRVKMITFTGSPEVGIGIRERAGLKRVVLELGSNSALIVDKDIDADSIIDRCVTGAFSFQGQVCIALQRIYVHEELYEHFVEKFVQKTMELKFGDPLDEDTDLSALISKADVNRTVSWLDEAKSLGGRVVAGGTTEGNILLPTVVVDVDAKAKLSCQEVFAPIVIINKFQKIEEAYELVNDSRFGLQAGIYTENINTALEATSKLHVGGVMVNDIPTFRVDHMPYGGVKESGVGREGIKYSMEEMMEMKLVVWNKTK